MSKTLHSYYLQQMGIETWTIRKPVIQQIKLWVIGQSIEVNQKAHNLCNKMFNSIGLLPEDINLKSDLSEQLIHEIGRNPPQLIVAMDNTAIHALLNTSEALSSLRGQVHFFHNTPVVVSYSPVDLLQNPMDKKSAYHDLLLIQHLLSKSSC